MIVQNFAVAVKCKRTCRCGGTDNVIVINFTH